METTAERIKTIMDERGLKQKDILERAKPICAKYGGKLTRSDLSQYCSGRVAPKQQKLFIIAAALNVSESWLMGYDVPRERTYSVTIECEEASADKAHLPVYYAKIAQKLAYLGEDARDRILHQLDYEYEQEQKKQSTEVSK